MGGCPMGGYGWGSVREDELLAAIHAALDVGVNFFDTADTYGLGQSERTLAKGLGTHRKAAVIETKFGVRADLPVVRTNFLSPVERMNRICWRRRIYLKQRR